MAIVPPSALFLLAILPYSRFGIPHLAHPIQRLERSYMSDSGYGSKSKAILAAQGAMRARFGAQVRFEPIPPNALFPRAFLVSDAQGTALLRFRVFRSGGAIQEWAWEEMSADA
jgi:hypothetical protein